MKINKYLNTIIYYFFSIFFAQILYATSFETTTVRLIPQESYGEEVLDLLNRRGQDGVRILQFNFFTDNPEETFPKQIAQKLMDLRSYNPTSPIIVALESKKDLDAPNGKGAAQRNLKTKKLLTNAGIEVRDVHGLTGSLQVPPSSKDGVTHTKLVIAGNELIAGSSNLTKQSTDIGANNEMNIAVQSEKISVAARDYVDRIIKNPGQMVDLEVEDAGVRLLTDRLHFNELIFQIKSAQKGDQLGLSMYQFLYRNERDQQAKQVLDELIAAHKRGAVVEVYLNRAQDLATQNTETNLRVAELLLEAGIHKVYFDPEAKISHSKFLYRTNRNERVAVISSVNIYAGDFNNNHQLTWVLKDNPVVDELVSYFKQQIAYDGILVSRIPKDSITGLRYKIESSSNKMSWNPPVPVQRMLRFWRGFKQENVTRQNFEANVNSTLIPETIAVGEGRGLNAYLPSFFPDNKAEFLPDEVAIVDYRDEESYNAIRATKRGAGYGPLHFADGLFTRENSKGFKSGSLVASGYTGTVDLKPEGTAYILGSQDINWQNGVALRRTLLPLSDALYTPANIEQYFNALLKTLNTSGINGAVAIVDPRYILLMFNANDEVNARDLDLKISAYEKHAFRKWDHIIFEDQKYGATQLKPNSGINLKFEAQLQPSILKRFQKPRTACEGLFF